MSSICAIDDVGAHFRIVGLLKQIMGEQFFVERARDFGEEDRIIVILKELDLVREPGVHRVPGLVSERVNVGEHIALVIHQDIRRRVVAAGGEGATAFPFRLVTIAPAAVQAFGSAHREYSWPSGASDAMTLSIASSKVIAVSIS